eukprot:1964178-Alexandrium_andersonii.AAC.1
MNAMKQKVYAGAFYGAAAAPVRKQFKRALVTCVADCVVSSKSSNRSPDVACVCVPLSPACIPMNTCPSPGSARSGGRGTGTG